MDTGDTVDDASKPERVVRAIPWLAGNRDSTRHGAVDIGEIPGLDIAVGPTSAGEHPERLSDLLLQVKAHARSTGVSTHRVYVGRHSGRLGERDRVSELSGAATAKEARNLELARL